MQDAKATHRLIIFLKDYDNYEKLLQGHDYQQENAKLKGKQCIK